LIIGLIVTPFDTPGAAVSQYQIAVIVGSVREASFNRKLADAIVKLAPPEFSFKQVDIGTLPLYNQEDEAMPALAQRAGMPGILMAS
jgi:NAD(P)H-dependent FMN reductase